MTEIILERFADVLVFSPQNLVMPRVSSTDADTLAVQDLVESLQNPTPNVLFATINYTHHTALRILAGLFNIIPKALEQQSTHRNTNALRDNFPGFACWGDLILSEFQNQFCACSAQPRQTCELVLLFNAKIPVSFHIKYCVLERGKDKRNIECFKENNYVTVWSIVGRNT